MSSVTPACIDKNEIREVIPHSGSMCLLDAVLAWDEQSILCTSQTHLDRANPLRRDEHLSAIHAFEYGAQAVAIHGSLRARAAGTVAPPGYLAALRDATASARPLDQFSCPLEVRANRLFSDRANCVYECRVSAGAEIITQGRVTIILRDERSTESNSGDNLSATAIAVTRISMPAFEIQCRIPAHHPSLPGHFPGQPIIPGVVILDEVGAALAEWRQSRITHIHFTKFLSPLNPEQTFTISLANASGANQITFQCRVENRPIAEGLLEVTSHD
jgi:predicted hotdog family 3-hydroxylacyl-ACP dehydratase